MKIETFEQAQQYLESQIRFSGASYHAVQLERIQKFLEPLGNPQNKFAAIHVGGTAGKGSTATIVATILSTAGYKTGLHTSPHLFDVRERIQINNKFISKEQFTVLLEELREVIENMRNEYDFGAPTYFEALVAMAFLHFAKEKVAIAVIEVGMGGRIDATNVIQPLVTVLTNVHLDHTEHLGDTIEKIATEKVGIFKKDIPVISGVHQPSVEAIVTEKAAKQHSPLLLLGKQIQVKIVEENETGSNFDFILPNKTLKDVHLKLIGEHQIQNASLAIGAVLALPKSFTVTDEHIKTALQNVQMSGRFEIFHPKLPATSYQPPVIFDGAHNPAKITALVKTIQTIYPNKKIRCVFACKKGKNVSEILEILEPIVKKFYFTKFFQLTDFGKNTAEEPKTFKNNTKIPYELFEDNTKALEKAIAESSSDDIICITGSLFLVGELRSSPSLSLPLEKREEK